MKINQVNKKKYEEFINSIELVDEIIPEFFWHRRSAKIEPGKIKIVLNLKTLKPVITNGFFECGNTLEMKGVSKEEGILFSIKGTVVLRLRFENDFSEECIEIYSKQTASFSTIPTFRVLVRDALQKMSLPPFTLPLLKSMAPGSEKK